MKSLQELIPGALILALLAVSTSGASAQEPSRQTFPPSIQVTAEGTFSARPDLARVQVGVVNRAPTAQAAGSENARRLDSVLTGLRKELGPESEVKTVGYSLSPYYRSPGGGGSPTIAGYTARNIIQATTDDLSRIGKIIDVATRYGANDVGSVRFTLRNEEGARLRALKEAAVRARAEAEALASALGLKMGAVLKVEESSLRVMPQLNDFRLRAGAVAPTPIEPGTIEVRATVTLTVRIGN